MPNYPSKIFRQPFEPLKLLRHTSNEGATPMFFANFLENFNLATDTKKLGSNKYSLKIRNPTF